MITSLGEYTIGEMIPQPYAGILTAIGELQERIALNVALAAQIQVNPPSMSANLTLSYAITENIQASLSLTPPSISAQLTIIDALLVELRAKLDLLLAIPFATAGVYAYAYDGQTSSLGTELSAAIGTETGHSNALVLVVKESVVWNDFSMVFKVSP
jgi:hypothetical protein